MSEKELMEMFADNLQAELEDAQMTINELAEESGVSRTNIHYYLHGERIPSLKNLMNIMVALDCEFYDLIDEHAHID